MDNKLVIAVKEQGLEETQSQMLLKKFTGFFEEASKWEKEANAIVITDESQVVEMAKAREIRLALKGIRVDSEKVRISLKERIVREGKAIDGVANVIKALVVPIEEYLEKQEKFIENLQASKQKEILEQRTNRLSLYVDDISIYNFAVMSDAVFEELLSDVKRLWENKQDDIKKAEQDVIENQKKVDLFNGRTIMLAPYAFFFGAVDKELTMETTDPEFKAILTALSHAKKQFDDDQELIKIENDKLKKDAEKKEAQDKKDREDAHIERERILAEQKRKDDEAAVKLKEVEDAKKKLEDAEFERKMKEEKERIAKIEAEREAKLAPEKDKLTAYAESIRTIQAPADLSKAGLEIVKQVEAKLLAISQEIKTKVKEL